MSNDLDPSAPANLAFAVDSRCPIDASAGIPQVRWHPSDFKNWLVLSKAGRHGQKPTRNVVSSTNINWKAEAPRIQDRPWLGCPYSPELNDQRRSRFQRPVRGDPDRTRSARRFRTRVDHGLWRLDRHGKRQGRSRLRHPGRNAARFRLALVRGCCRSRARRAAHSSLPRGKNGPRAGPFPARSARAPWCSLAPRCPRHRFAA